MPWRCAWPPERGHCTCAQPTGDIELREVTTGRTMLSAPADATEAVNNADGSLIATTGRDRALRLLDAATGDLQHGIRVGNAPCTTKGGHALVGMLAEGADPVRKISISPRGQSFGVTFAAPHADRHNYSDRELRARTDVALGRRAAEEIVLGGVTTGAEALGLWGSRPRIIGRASSDDLAVHFA